MSRARHTWSPQIDTAVISGSIYCDNNLDKITRIFGVPLRCRTGGGPQFRKPFNDYCHERGILHETSSPYNPRSNGHAEAAVKAAKHLLLKTAPAEFLDALAAWRNTSREEKPSPNELMFCRKVRDGKVIIKSHLEIRTPTTSHQRIPLQSCLKHDDQHHEGSDTQQQPLQQIPDHFLHGDRVCVQNPHTKRWDVEAFITDFSHTGRTLNLCTDKGYIMRRNRCFIRRRCVVQEPRARELPSPQAKTKESV